ncbi:DNA oxidative demethylase ALKBH2 [Narcine bancroftii]|uniref:DNA oxidative demethylase ALKBH2 n=1 Tax=Narcine bancroftii TaxID=1343680 RepID=UPI003831B685
MDKFLIVNKSKNPKNCMSNLLEMTRQMEKEKAALSQGEAENPRKRRKENETGGGDGPSASLLAQQNPGRNVELSWKQIRDEGLNCDYTKLFPKPEADDVFLELEKVLEYFSGDFTKVQVFGKWHNIPRKQVTYGDPGLTYRYSGVTLSPKPWIPVLERIKERVMWATGCPFNFVLVNRYKDGIDHIGEHRDDEKELEPHSPIASVSFGACRDFVFRHRDARGKSASRRLEPVKLLLGHGSLLVMNYPTNVYWYHSLPARKKVLTPRVNLTFRQVLPSLKN